MVHVMSTSSLSQHHRANMGTILSFGVVIFGGGEGGGRGGEWGGGIVHEAFF